MMYVGTSHRILIKFPPNFKMAWTKWRDIAHGTDVSCAISLLTGFHESTPLSILCSPSVHLDYYISAVNLENRWSFLLQNWIYLVLQNHFRFQRAFLIKKYLSSFIVFWFFIALYKFIRKIFLSPLTSPCVVCVFVCVQVCLCSCRCPCLCVCMWVCAFEYRCPWKPEEGAEFPGTWVPGHYESLGSSARNCTQALCKNSKHFNHWAICPVP